MSEAPKSHGRGGAGNIGADTTEYSEGSPRISAQGESATGGAFSTGRGGAGNIGSPGLKATHERKDEVIPESDLAKHSAESEGYHVGRGGQGNAVAGESSTHTHTEGEHKEGLVDKLKHKVLHKD